MADNYTPEYDQDLRVIPQTKGIQVSVLKRMLLNGVPDSDWKKVDQYIIPPGGDGHSATKTFNAELKRLISAAHAPTVVTLYQAKQTVQATEQALQQAEADYQADSKAANKTARDKAKTAATAAKTARDSAQAASDAFEAA